MLSHVSEDRAKRTDYLTSDVRSLGVFYLDDPNEMYVQPHITLRDGYKSSLDSSETIVIVAESVGPKSIK